MLRSKTLQTIRDLAAQGKPIRAIAQETGIARNTVRKYLRGTPEAAPRPRRGSKLDPFKDQIRRWVREDRLLNCEEMLTRLQALGYRGKVSIVKDFVKPLRPLPRGSMPVRRFETKPGEQVQFDWGEFLYEQDGQMRKLYGFTAILSYARLRYVCFMKRADTESLIRALMNACEYFEGLPKTFLTDRMKSVLLEMDGTTPVWNPLFAEFLSAVGCSARVCRPYTPQTKGKVERSIRVVKESFWPGVQFRDLDDLNSLGLGWCERLAQKVHATTRARPIDRWVEEQLRPLPVGFAWARFGLEPRQVTIDGFVSYDGVLYGLPAQAQLVGTTVLVGCHCGQLRIYAQGQLVAEHTARAVSGTQVLHPEQFSGVPVAAKQQQARAPLGHQVAAVRLERRSLADYDQLCGVVLATEMEVQR
jgi:transposase